MKASKSTAHHLSIKYDIEGQQDRLSVLFPKRNRDIEDNFEVIEGFWLNLDRDELPVSYDIKNVRPRYGSVERTRLIVPFLGETILQAIESNAWKYHIDGQVKVPDYDCAANIGPSRL